MRILPRVAWQVVEGEAVLLDLEAGTAIGLNETGSFLWPRLESRSVPELARDLSESFKVEPAEAHRDVVSFVDFLRARGYVEG